MTVSRAHPRPPARQVRLPILATIQRQDRLPPLTHLPLANSLLQLQQQQLHLRGTCKIFK